MRDVYNFANYFLKQEDAVISNTYDGNMKLQKLLTMANFIHIAQYGTSLFDDDILAFRNGCVIEKVRKRYKYDYHSFKRDSELFQPDFNDDEYKVLNIVSDVFGKLSAKELSDINHSFEFWKDAYSMATNENGYHSKTRSVVDMTSHKDDIDRINNVIKSFYESKDLHSKSELINGVVFYYNDFEMTDDIIDKLESFSLTAEDDSYNVYFDNNEMVVY